MTPDLAASRFEGEEVVTLDVEEPVDALVCNAAELEIQAARLETPAGANLDGRVELDEAAQRATIAFDSTLPAGSGYRLHLRFTGMLNDQLHGFYRSTFTDDEGVEHVIAVTQFEPADARRAFPCWDEPEFKAIFAVTLVVDDRLTALANASVASEEPAGDGRRRVRFHETMLMSTYLVAFVVGPFELTPPVEVDGVPLRVAAVPGKSHLTGFAVEVGTHALRFLSQYFELPYPADKIDHVAIPDFAFGAMENLGCVTYRENALLVDPPEASQLELQRVATVVAHETAHMWFGDLVTMKWWNGIWLNEAFATFMELAANEHYRPDWQVWIGFGTGKAAALATDGLRSTRPVEFDVGRPEEAEAMFDVLTYQKGGAVLRMLEQYIGPETFRKGISHYLSIHAHANTETGDLWDAIEAVSGEPVRTIMDSWIFQGGYPLISVEAGGQPGNAPPVPTAVPLRRRRPRIRSATAASAGPFRSTCGRRSAGWCSGSGCWSTAPPRRSTSTVRSTGWSSTTGPGVSTGSTTTTTCCRACSERAWPRCATRSSAWPWCSTTGPAWCRAPFRSTSGSVPSRPSATRRTRTCGRRSAAPSASSTSSPPTGTTGPPCRAFVRRVGRPVVDPPRVGSGPGRGSAHGHHPGPGSLRPGPARR